MNTLSRLSAVVVLASAATSVFGDAGVPVKGWMKAGNAPQLYDMGVADGATYSGKRSAFIRSRGAVPKGFGTLMQTVEASSYDGKRVRLSAYVKADDVKSWAGLWMRVDSPYGKVQVFDNMQKRPIKGSSKWRRYEVVLDVPKTAQEISFGLLLDGEGSVLLNQVRVEVVGTDVPATAAAASQVLPRPTNLDFEE